MIRHLPQIIRIYTLPMSVFCWFVAFLYSYSKGGNVFYGLIALLGICLVHLGVNVFDDFVDYKLLELNNKKADFNTHSGKCEPILKNIITEKQMLFLSLFLFFWASCTGLFFIIKTGIFVFYLMIITGILCLLYPIMGKFRLCEITLGIIYGPLLFSGVFYVMNSFYDWHILILCLPIMLITVNLLYTDSSIDYKVDKKEGKKTLANWFPDQWGSYKFHIFLICLIYLSVIFVYLTKLANGFVFLTFLTVPMGINLLYSMKQYIVNPNILPKMNFLDGIIENWDNAKKEGSEYFMLRMYQARNYMIAFSTIFAISFSM